MRTQIYCIVIAVLIVSCGQATNSRVNQLSSSPAQVDTCNDPDASINCCFVNTPVNVSEIMTIGGKQEPGEKLVITGTIFKEDGRTPFSNVVLYAYHTDSKGYYSKTGRETGVQKWHGHLHGWCKSDSNGHYEIRTIRPARYPDNSLPAHIHAAIKKPDTSEAYYISDFVFKDDSLVNDQYLKSIGGMVGGSGVVDLAKSKDGPWTGRRDISLPK